MNEQTEKLLRELSDKLGTTVDHLWQVLIRQAPISAATALLQYAFLGVCVWLWWRLFRYVQKIDGDREIGIGLGLLLALTGFALFGVILFALFSIPETMAGSFNPEYWALKQLIH